jgi:tRNA nucleotidyltransferase (CCA-adding enzyme)
MKSLVNLSHLERIKEHSDAKALLKVNEVLSRKGYRSLLAGGAVRDVLLGKMPKDLDIATSATPDEVEALFSNTISVGKAFGVIRVRLLGGEIEVATFRKDGEYADGRHPKEVTFSVEKEDALRRDFTINGLFLDLQTGEVIDFVDGLLDLQKKELRAIGNPEKRFFEDHLRILRGFRFSAQLGFQINAETLKKAKELSLLLNKVSYERLKDEFQKLLLCDHLQQLDSLGFQEICCQLFKGDLIQLNSSMSPHFFKTIQELKQSLVLLNENKNNTGITSQNPRNEDLWVFFLATFLVVYRLDLLKSGGIKQFLKSTLQKWRFSRHEDREILSSMDLFFSCGEFLKKPFYKKLYADQGRIFILLKILKPSFWPQELVQEILNLEIPLGLLQKKELPSPLVSGDDFKGQLMGAALGEFLEESYELQLKGLLKTREDVFEFFLKFRR